MTIIELFDMTVKSVQEYGYNKSNVNVFISVSKTGINYSCNIWDSKKCKFLRTNNNSNPSSMIESIKDTILFDRLQYDSNQKDINI